MKRFATHAFVHVAILCATVASIIRGRMYAVPLEVPQAVDLFATAEIAADDGHIYVAWPGQPLEKAVPLRSKELYDALKWLHQHNRHYRERRIAACLRNWRRRLASANAHPTPARPTQHPDAKCSDVPETGDPAVLDEDIVHLTSGGPMPVGANAHQLEQLRGSTRLEPGIDELMFPALFPDGHGGWKGGSFASYVRQRLLGADPRFQQTPEYVFWLLETWFKKQVSASTSVHVGRQVVRVGGRDQLKQKVYSASASRAPFHKTHATWNRRTNT